MGGIVAALLSVLFLSTSLVSPQTEAFNQNRFQSLVEQGINPAALRVALKAYHWADAHGKVKKKILTVVDFTKPSTKKRMWVISMITGKILFNGLVTHGSGSGGLYAHHFSNKNGTKASSLGAMVTGDDFQGKHGLAVKVHGLEDGVNDNANSRAVEFHSASYATQKFADKTGRLGRSWGCFAVNPKYSHYVFNTIKDGSFVFSYAPQEKNDTNFS